MSAETIDLETVGSADFRRIPMAGRLRALRELWASIVMEQEALTDDASVVEELRRRKARHLAHPESAIPWEVVRERIRARHQSLNTDKK